VDKIVKSGNARLQEALDLSGLHGQALYRRAETPAIRHPKVATLGQPSVEVLELEDEDAVVHHDHGVHFNRRFTAGEALQRGVEEPLGRESPFQGSDAGDLATMDTGAAQISHLTNHSAQLRGEPSSD